LHKLSKTLEFNLSQKSIESGETAEVVDGLMLFESGILFETS